MGREILVAAISTAVPFITILIGMMMNNKRFDALDNRFDAMEKGVNSRFDKIEAHLSQIDADLRRFYHLTGVMEGKIALLEKKLL